MVQGLSQRIFQGFVSVNCTLFASFRYFGSRAGARCVEGTAMSVLIKNGRIVTAVDDDDADILIQGLKIVRIGK